MDHLGHFLSREPLQAKARSCGFIRRGKKLTSYNFLGMLLYCSSLEGSSSLDSMCNILEEFWQVDMRKQSLDERFNASCLDFVKSVLQEILEDQLHSSGLYQGDFWKAFSLVRIKDSTKFKVPDLMKGQFKGNGGSAASICIQYEYDLATGKILDLTLSPGGSNDRAEAIKSKDQPGEGELVIRDLGYHSLEVFKTFEDNKAFFLSRLHSATSVYEFKGGRWKEVDFGKIYDKMRSRGIKQIQMQVYLGQEYKLPVRMVLSVVDDPVYEKRIRAREAENRKRGQKMSEKTRIRYHLNIYITNASEEQLPEDQIYPAYRLRWQIELIFKCWKSLYKVHQGGRMKQDRYLCMLYAKLILIAINLQLTRSLQKDIQKTDEKGNRHFLSIYKVMRTLKAHYYQVHAILLEGINKRGKELRYLLQKIARNHWLERKKKKWEDTEIIDLML